MMSTHEPQHRATGKKGPDFNLITTRLKQMALQGEKTEKCRLILGKQTVRRLLDVRQLQEWSEAALIIGSVDLALELLTEATERFPDDPEAWRKRHDVLRRLQRSDQAESVRARALALHPALEKHLAAPVLRDHPEETQPEVDDPFVRHREQEEGIALYLQCFQGREDVFARQWADKEKGTQGYMPVRRAMTGTDVLDHIKGRKTFGMYLLRSDSRVWTAVIDIDLKKNYRSGHLRSADKNHLKRERDYLLKRLTELSQERLQVKPLQEFSGGKGYHLWFFFQEPVPAGTARQVLLPIVSEVAGDCQYFSLETFPKQSKLQGKGLGNLVKLPLGLHRVSGKPSYFLGCPKNDPWANIKALQDVQRLQSETVRKLPEQDGQAKTILHPRHSQWAKDYPELHILSEKCPPLGRIITALRSGQEIGFREEKTLLQTIGFLSRARLLLHHLYAKSSEYNVHLVDYKLSKLRGTPLGCKKIHQFFNFQLEFCRFETNSDYLHPLLHCPEYMPGDAGRSESVDNLQDALRLLKTGLNMVSRFLPSD